MNQNDIITIKQHLEAALGNIQSAKKILYQQDSAVDNSDSNEIMNKAKEVQEPQVTEDGKVIEGVFDGQNMIGPDGKQYSVPANYASKSKLVQGDTLKLTITPDGSFRYKQIKPVDRERIIGVLSQENDSDKYFVLANNHQYRVLLASVTYFKGESGDEAVILKPKNIESNWAAVENIIKPLPGAPVQTLMAEVEKVSEIEEPVAKPNFLPEVESMATIAAEEKVGEENKNTESQEASVAQSEEPQQKQEDNNLEEI